MWAIYAERVRGDFTVLAWLPYKMGLNMVIVSEDCGGEKLVEEGDVIIGYIKK
jgi:hypothetical protein